MSTGPAGSKRFPWMLLVWLALLSTEVDALDGAFCKAGVARAMAQKEQALALGCDRIQPILRWQVANEDSFRESCYAGGSGSREALQADFSAWLDRRDNFLKECRDQLGGGESECSANSPEQQRATREFRDHLLPVLRHPRCANCHGALDLFAKNTAHPGGSFFDEEEKLRETGWAVCADCHDAAPKKKEAPQEEQWRAALSDSARWGLASEHKLCGALKASEQSAAEFIAHVQGDIRVRLGFEGKSGQSDIAPAPPPRTHAQFVEAVRRWAEAMGGEKNWGKAECGCRGLSDSAPPALPAPGTHATLPRPPPAADPRVQNLPVGTMLKGGAIAVQSATYGLNCGATPSNVTHHARQTCNGKTSCDYVVDFHVIGDPASGCPKDYAISWSCGTAPGGTLSAPPEAGYGAVLKLRCGGAAAPPPGAPQPAMLGCFKDQGETVGLQGRDLDGAILRDDRMTTQMCVSQCGAKGFAYAGTQYGAFCFCGNQYGRSGAASNCDMPCAGNPQEICGGGWANSVYATRGAASAPAPSGNACADACNRQCGGRGRVTGVCLLGVLMAGACSCD